MINNCLCSETLDTAMQGGSPVDAIHLHVNSADLPVLRRNLLGIALRGNDGRTRGCRQDFCSNKRNLHFMRPGSEAGKRRIGYNHLLQGYPQLVIQRLLIAAQDKTVSVPFSGLVLPADV